MRLDGEEDVRSRQRMGYEEEHLTLCEKPLETHYPELCKII